MYGFVDRQNLPGTMRVFDFASPDAHCPQRFTTTVPQQALFLMNSSFAQEQADALTSRARAADPAQRIEQLYLLAFARKPTAEEIALGLAYLKDDGSEDAWARYAQVLLASNEFVFVD